MASGLKINLHKSNLLGIRVSKAETDLAASIMGCSTFSPPFHYLEVKIGASISRIILWKEVTDKISSRLSKWKIKTLSSGGRLTLLKSVLTALSLYYMSIYKAPSAVLKDLESIRRDFFHGVDKVDRKMVWVCWEKIWRFLTQCSSLLSSLIKAIHGVKGNIDDSQTKISGSIWEWREYSLLGRHLARSGIKDEQYKNLVSITSNVLLPQMHDRWSWSLNALGDFTVRLVRNHMDDVRLPKSDVPTHWVTMIPIKINILAWEISMDRLPT
ncbi:hypothetical protein Tco_0019050 [Tanacetum coccineum]